MFYKTNTCLEFNTNFNHDKHIVMKVTVLVFKFRLSPQDIDL